MQELLGVKFLPNVSNKKPWRAQINRCNKGFYLGLFRTSEEACRAYDNAVYYLRPWAAHRTAMCLNFPAEWEQDIPEPNAATIKTRKRLRELFPEKEQADSAKGDLSTSEALEHSIMALLETHKSSSSMLEKRMAALVCRLRLFEARINDLEKEVEKRDRIIEGLRVQGGQQFFKRVGPSTVPATPVENHLDT